MGPQIPVGGGRDAGHAEFVGQPVLQGTIDPLAAAARLGGIAEDVLDAEAGGGAADLGGPPPIGGAAGGGGVHGPVSAVGVEGHGQAVA